MKANKIRLNNETILDLSQDTVTEEDVASGKTFHKADGSSAIGMAAFGVEWNIAYGDTAPEDTSKLWVKTPEPSGDVLHRISPVIEDEYLDKSTHIGYAPSGVMDAGYGLVGSKLYILGGGAASSGSNTIRVYDFDTLTTTTLSTTLLSSRWGISSATIGTKIYMLGGANSSNAMSGGYCFDTDTGTVSSISGTYRWGAACAAVGTKIYSFGGKFAPNTSYNDVYDYIYCYDTDNDTQTLLSTKLPVALGLMGCAAVGTKIYLFGGEAGTNKPVDSIYCFDTETEEIEKLSTTLEKSVFMQRCVNVDDDIYITGGTPSYSGTTDGYIYKFNVINHTMEKLSCIDTNSLGTIFVFYNGTLYMYSGGYRTSYYAPSGTNSSIRKITFGSPMLLPEGVMRIKTTSGGTIVKLIKSNNAEVEEYVQMIFVGNTEGIGKVANIRLYKNGTWTPI